MSRSMRWVAIIVLCASPALLFAGNKEKEKGASTKVVDSGKFGIFVRGARVGTETFTIEQNATGSNTHCEVSIDQDGSRIEQKSDMQLAANGDLLHYEWKELTPGHASDVVVPDEKFLLEHIYPGDKAKPLERPLLMPSSTVILDDFFFTHRELLAWRYIGLSCKPGDSNCTMKKTNFGALVPRTASPVLAGIEYKGQEKLSIRGAEMNLFRFDLDVDGTNWSMWMDSNYKIQRFLVAANATEVVRD